MPQRRRPGRMRRSKQSHSSRPRYYKIACANCGREVIVQVPPPEDKKLLCMDCFKK